MIKTSITGTLGLFLCLLIIGCSDPQQKAMKRLEKQGIAFKADVFVRYVEAGDEKLVRDFLTAGMPVDSSQVSGERPFYRALKKKDLKMANLLLDAGAWYVDPRDPEPVLRIAIEQNAAKVANRLLQAGVSIKTAAADRSSLLANAIQHGGYESAYVLLDHGFNPNGLDITKRPAMHWAIEKGKHDLLEKILQKQGNANILDKDRIPALVLAVRKQDASAAKMLIAAGADVNLMAPDKKSLLTHALEQENWELCQELIAAGIDVNHHTKQGLPPIHHALRSNQVSLSLMRSMVKAKASLDARDKEGFIPLEIALHLKKYVLAKLFIEAGTQPRNAVYQVARAGDLKGLSLLLEKGFPVNLGDIGDTPLGAAVRRQDVQMTKILLENKADPNSTMAEGQLPLHLAVVRQDIEMVRLLLQYGAKADAPFIEPVKKRFRELVKRKRMQWFLREDRRVMPLMVAADAGDVELAKSLLESGADVNSYTRKHRMWAVNFAARNKDIPMMRLLLKQNPYTEERKVVVDLSEQMARVYQGGRTVMSFRVSTGKKGHRTPKGKFVITNKYKDWTSTLYDSKMPYFQRLNCGDFGLHEGYVPRHAASHGCIRVPKGTARKLFKVTKLGDRVEIVP